ncbi:MAG: GntR family transcriptional regulator [Spirochaetes bacterium]|nr:GntR family transcriptional regulator [Spirochaetota bacterium]
MRVRQYLYNLLRNSGGRLTQIPPENELCQRFQVSRVTVRGAIEGLVKDGYLIPRRGIGTFINPARIDSSVTALPTIGILRGDGRQATTPFDPFVAQCVKSSGMIFQWLHLPESRDSDRFAETVRSGMDAVIWESFDPTPEQREMANALIGEGIPLLVVDFERARWPARIDAVVSDGARRGARAAEYIHARGHRRFLMVHNIGMRHHRMATGATSTHRSMEKRLHALWRSGERPSAEAWLLRDFNEHMSSHRRPLSSFSLLYTQDHLLPWVAASIERSGLSVPGDLSILVYGRPDPRFLGGLEADYIDRESGMRQAIFDWLEKRVVKRVSGGLFHREIDMNIISGSSIKTLRKEAMKGKKHA